MKKRKKIFSILRKKARKKFLKRRKLWEKRLAFSFSRQVFALAILDLVIVSGIFIQGDFQNRFLEEKSIVYSFSHKISDLIFPEVLAKSLVPVIREGEDEIKGQSRSRYKMKSVSLLDDSSGFYDEACQKSSEKKFNQQLCQGRQAEILAENMYREEQEQKEKLEAQKKARSFIRKVRAPMPKAEVRKDEFGRLICKKKNDDPGKSNKGKGKHMDMECCLDPDEYPNPNCYYGSEYKKYLK